MTIGLAVDAQIVGDVADGWANRNFDAVRGVAQANGFVESTVSFCAE